MKNKLLYLVIPSAAFVVLYLLFSFGAWDMNPKNWDHFARIVMAFFWLVISIRCLMLEEDVNKNKNKHT